MQATTEKHQAATGHSHAQQQTGQLEVVYYTDPLCCWSWAFEPAWQQLLREYEGRISWRYCMGGLLADWKAYHDTMNAVSKPLQMGPLWMQARQVSGQPLNDRIWFLDPPASSYPACLAVKCAGLQSARAEHLYLYYARNAVMAAGRNIAKKAVLLEAAADLETAHPGTLDLQRFEADLQQDAALALFRQDLQEVSYRNITRFPTLVIHSAGKKSVMMTGYRPYEALAQLLAQL
ncbi:DsbA family protein [Chitinophaga japonensis]|nr:DsbA family protein [Chitinophaga japonensis]